MKSRDTLKIQREVKPVGEQLSELGTYKIAKNFHTVCFLSMVIWNRCIILI